MKNDKLFQEIQHSQTTDPNEVLSSAQDRLKQVLIIGWTKDDGHFYISSSTPKSNDQLILIELAKHLLISNIHLI